MGKEQRATLIVVGILVAVLGLAASWYWSPQQRAERKLRNEVCAEFAPGKC